MPTKRKKQNLICDQLNRAVTTVASVRCGLPGAPCLVWPAKLCGHGAVTNYENWPDLGLLQESHQPREHINPIPRYFFFFRRGGGGV